MQRCWPHLLHRTVRVIVWTYDYASERDTQRFELPCDKNVQDPLR